MLRLIIISLLIFDASLGQNPLLRNENIARTDLAVEGYRLNVTAVPSWYYIILEPDFDTFEFLGATNIEATVVQDTNTIQLHSFKLDIDSISVRKNGIDLLTTTHSLDKEKQFLNIHLREGVQKGDILNIAISYVGYLNANNEGFYRAKFVDENGTDSWLGTTQFEPTKARQAFPCFDEPALKAEFTIRIIRKEGYNSASNMPLERSYDIGLGKYMDTFEKTVPMSTYLIAFVVSKLDKISLGSQGVIGTKKALSDGQADYALRSSKAVLDAMEYWTHVPYTLAKMDQVGMPNAYFSAGAMENWGLVIYRESLLYYKENVSSAEQKQAVLSIISHEYGHQWFGNLVSPLWWEFIWLNEGFATYFEYRAADEVDKSMRMMEQFVVSTNQYVFRSDSKAGTRAMTTYAEKPNDISRLFDIIAYDKSGAVIRMVEHILAGAFSRGLEIYLKNRQFKAGQPSDLFSALQTAAEETENFSGSLTINEIFETWHTQAGYPLITATRDYENNKLHLKQNRFRSDTNNSETPEIWIVPVNSISKNNLNNNTNPDIWLKTREENFTLAAESWIVLNKKSTGYYRVNYDNKNWEMISKQLLEDHKIIDPLNRAQLIDDSFTLAKAGILNYEVPLKLTQYIKNETDYIPLSSYYYHASLLEKLLRPSAIYNTYKANVRSLLKLAFETDGFTEIKEHTRILNRNKVYNIMCRFGHEDCIDNMEKMLLEHLKTGNTLQPDLQTPVYCGGMVGSNNLEFKWTEMYRKYVLSNEAGEKKRIVEGLACSSDKNILKRVLETAIGMYRGHNFDKTDVKTALRSVSGGSYLGAVASLEFLIEYSQTLDPDSASNILQNLGDALITIEHKQMLSKLNTHFGRDNDLLLQVQEAINSVEANLEWSKRGLQEITNYYQNVHI